MIELLVTAAHGGMNANYKGLALVKMFRLGLKGC
jgi:hypothetical protein